MQHHQPTPMKARAHAQAQASRTTQARIPAQADSDIAEYEQYYLPMQPARSAYRYTTANGQEVIQQGNRRLVIHREPPPKRHWLFPVGGGMVAMLVLFVVGSWFVTWWSTRQLDTTYGNPRTWQVDEVVGHGDSPSHSTHFIFENLHGQVVIIELPGGDLSHARIYSGPHLLGNNADSLPVTGEFKDINGDGKLDMVVHVGDQSFVYFNDGTQFKPQQTAGSNPRHTYGGTDVRA